MENIMTEVSFYAILTLSLLGCIKPCWGFHVDLASSGKNEEIINLTHESDKTIPAFSHLDRYYIHGKELHPKDNFQERAPQLDPERLKLQHFTKHLLTDIAKRTWYANSREEIRDIEGGHTHSTGEPRVLAENSMQKRNDQTEYHSGGCTAERTWVSLGPDYFPRFVKSYNCSSESCGRDVGECRPKSYTVKVLKMKSIENLSMNDEACDMHLPEQLRCDWNLEPISVTTYCECFSINLALLTG